MTMLVCRKLPLAFVLLVLATLHHSPPMVGSQTLAQEERFEACCKGKQIPGIYDCSYRELQSMFHFGPNTDTRDTYTLSDITGLMLFFGCDQLDYTCANKLWPSYIDCLNNGKDNRECCFASPNVKGQLFPRECTPFCNGVDTATIDMDSLNKTNCGYYWKEVIVCAMKA